MKLYEINSKREYDFSCIYLWVNLTNKEAAKRSGTSRQNISHVLNGHQSIAGGYHWEYV